MSDAKLSDDEIIALTRTRHQQRLIGVIFVALMTSVAGMIGVFKLNAYLMIGTLATIAIFGLVTVFYYTREPQGAYSERIMAKRVDEMQWYYRRYFLIVVPGSLLIFAIIGEIETIRIIAEGFRPLSFIYLGQFFLFSGITLHMLTPYGTKRAWRATMNDELTRTMRTRSFAMGYWVIVPCLTLLFALGLHDRTLALKCMIPALYLAIATPALRYSYLDWRASRS